MNLPKIAISHRPPAAQQIAHQLLEYFVSGKAKPGDRLPSERQLAENLGVSRSIVREALKSLGMLSLIKVKPGGGYYLQDVPSNLLPRSVEWGLLLGERHTEDLVEARGFIEVAVARLAAERRDEKALKRLQHLLAELKEAGNNPRKFVEADIAFHITLSEASQNSALREILSGMRSLLDVWVRRVVYASEDLGPRYRRHLAIFEAIKKGDPEAAAQAMGEHMASASKSLRETLSKTPDLNKSSSKTRAHARVQSKRVPPPARAASLT
jgi:GntR family transcriptional regulator, transcriptional repressor for pyruvate dehydrogenase complex